MLVLAETDVLSVMSFLSDGWLPEMGEHEIKNVAAKISDDTIVTLYINNPKESVDCNRNDIYFFAILQQVYKYMIKFVQINVCCC